MIERRLVNYRLTRSRRVFPPVQTLFSWAAIWTIVLASSFILVPSAWAGSGISFSPTKIDNHFPQSLTFQTTIYSSSRTITSAWFIYTIQNDLQAPEENRVPLTFDPAQRVEVSITIGTESEGAIPGLPILVCWEAQDESGLRTRSEETLVRYEDNRFEWQVIEDDSISVWWHGHPREFGQQIFEIASTAVTDQTELFQTALPFPIRIMIYNNMEEFEVINLDGAADIGGRAFPEFGITAQIVPVNPYFWVWMSEVIPHEISHLYFTQVTTSILGEHPPAWLDEGIAQMNEPIDHTYETDLVQVAADKDDLIPLTDLTGGFDRYHGVRLELAYAESYSAVQFLIETHNRKSLSYFFPFYRSGWTTDYAFVSVLGYDMGEFQRRWLSWLGTSMTFPPTSTPLPIQHAKSHSTATREATERSQITTPTPSASFEVRSTPAPSRVMLPYPVPLPCIALALPSGLLLVFTVTCVIVWRKYRRDHES